jgi:hypothetical protein
MEAKRSDTGLTQKKSTNYWIERAEFTAEVASEAPSWRTVPVLNRNSMGCVSWFQFWRDIILVSQVLENRLQIAVITDLKYPLESKFLVLWLLSRRDWCSRHLNHNADMFDWETELMITIWDDMLPSPNTPCARQPTNQTSSQGPLYASKLMRPQELRVGRWYLNNKKISRVQ